MTEVDPLQLIHIHPFQGGEVVMGRVAGNLDHIGNRRHHTTRSQGRPSPGGRVLQRQAPSGGDIQMPRPGEVGFGVGLALTNIISAHHGLKGTGGERREDGVHEAAPRHGHQGAGNAPMAKFVQEIGGAGPPGDPIPNPRDHTVQEGINDPLHGENHRPMGLHVTGGVPKIHPHQGVGVGIGPAPVPMPVHHLEFAGDPVRLGVNERTVHVPEHR